MQYATSFAITGSALAAIAAAQSVAVNNVPTSFTAGQAGTFDVVKGPGPYTLQLRRGDSNNLSNVTYIDCSATDSTYSWTPSTQLESGNDYAIEVIQDGNINYSGEFSITGGAAPGSGNIPAAPSGCPSSGATSSSSSSASSSATSSASGYSYSSSATTMSTASRTGNNSNCAVTQIADGQPQAPVGCTPSVTPAPSTSAVYTPPAAPKLTFVPGYNYGAAPKPYAPQAGATGSPAASNNTMPTYTMPSSPTGGSNSGSSTGSAPGKSSSAPKSGAAQYGSSFALIAGAVAAFAFLN
ncbi:MAG: hypothetical protein Q9162_003122 [Coniocarpon cinnabarinum]